MDRIPLDQPELQALLESVLKRRGDVLSHASIEMTAPDADGCNWDVTGLDPGSHDPVFLPVARLRRTYVMRATRDFIYRGIHVHVETQLCPEDGRWRYLGLWTMAGAPESALVGRTLDSFDDSDEAINAATMHARQELDKSLGSAPGLL